MAATPHEEKAVDLALTFGALLQPAWFASPSVSGPEDVQATAPRHRDHPGPEGSFPVVLGQTGGIEVFEGLHIDVSLVVDVEPLEILADDRNDHSRVPV